MKYMLIYTNVFIIYCRLHKGLSAKTLRAYSIDLNQLWERTHGDLSKASICRYISHLHKSYKPRTCRRKIAVIKAFVHFLLIDDIIDSNPFDKIDASFREPSLLPRTIPLSIINCILKAAYNERKLAKNAYSDKMCLRDIAILEMLFATGARVSEMCSLTPDDIDLEYHSVRIFGKGSRERIVQIENTDVLEILREYSSAFSSDIIFSGYFFVNRLHRRLSEQSVREIINKYAFCAVRPYTSHPICSGIPLPRFCWRRTWISATYSGFLGTAPSPPPRYTPTLPCQNSVRYFPPSTREIR